MQKGNLFGILSTIVILLTICTVIVTVNNIYNRRKQVITIRTVEPRRNRHFPRPRSPRFHRRRNIGFTEFTPPLISGNRGFHVHFPERRRVVFRESIPGNFVGTFHS